MTSSPSAGFGPRAETATDAAKYITQAIGLPKPLSAQRMWQLAREGEIKVVRIGRRVWFPRAALDAFIAAGGSRALSDVGGNAS